MATSYSEIYDRFQAKISDYKILELDDGDVNEMMQGWLTSAVAHQKKIINDFNMDNDVEEFDTDLDEIEKELLSLGMVLEWLRPQINSTALTSQFIGGKEEKFYAQSNHLNSLQSLFKDTRLERKKLQRDYGYRNNSYLKA